MRTEAVITVMLILGFVGNALSLAATANMLATDHYDDTRYKAATAILCLCHASGLFITGIFLFVMLERMK